MDDIDKPCREHANMAHYWEMTRALLLGTKGMREAGEKYLPRADREPIDQYDSRVQRSFLHPGFENALNSLVGKPFSRPVTLGDDMPESMKKIMEDVDMQGTNITVFCAELMAQILSRGSVHILVDYPRPDVQPSNLGEERGMGLRPYWTIVSAENLIGWVHERTESGKWELVEARIREVEPQPKDEDSFEELEVERIRLLGPGRQQVFERAKGDADFEDVGSDEYSMERIPLVTIRAPGARGRMTAKPPLSALAELNVQHWQSASDQGVILHVARCPILMASGFEESEEIYISPLVAVRSSNASATLTYVEHSGAAIQAGQEDITRLEERMRSMGLEISSNGVEITATQAGIDSSATLAALSRLVAVVKDGVENALKLSAEWTGEENEGGSITIFDRFDEASKRDSDIPQLLAMRANGDISRVTLHSELKRRNFLPEDFDSDAEQVLLDEETMTGGDSGEFGQPPESIA